MYLESAQSLGSPTRLRRLEILLLAIGFVAGHACGPGVASSQAVTISLMGLTPASGAQLRRAALNEFTQNTGIQVDLVPTLGDSAEQLKLARGLLARRAGAPDVYVIDIVWAGELRNHLLDLRPYLTAGLSEELPALRRDVASDDRISTLPLHLNVGMLYYRSDLLAKYGYARPPDTWDELENMARVIQKGERAAGKSHFWGYVWQGSEYEGLTCDSLEWQASFGGGHIIEPDGTISVNNARLYAALRKVSNWIGFISPASVLSYRESDSLNVFRSGNAAFLRYWSSGFDAVTAGDSGRIARFGVALLPAGPSGRAQTMGGFSLGVSRYSAHALEAVQLVRYLCSRHVQERRVFYGHYLPTLSPLYEQKELVAVLPQMALLKRAEFASWVMRPSTITGDKYPDVSREYYQTIHGILARTVRADEALPAMERKLADLTGFKTGTQTTHHVPSR
jgi:trehalose/maltose transport system substrate-binding protein